MKTRLAQILIVAFFVLLTCAPAGTATQSQKFTSLTATAKGQGTITVSDPQAAPNKRAISSIVVTLKEGGEAEIVVITDMQLFATGRWTAPSDPTKGISLKITGGVVSGNAKGSGKLFLRSDGKSIDRLNFEVKSTARSKVTVEFVAEKQSTSAAQ
ncbi:MAG TPA: hypothetical protein VFB65_14605 [Pyrinomonadaceae bacterium]|nr:hypothetical protein [Pyrinomonadaceae bacterium]